MIQLPLALLVQSDIKVRNIENTDWARVTGFHYHLYSDIYTELDLEGKDRHIVSHNQMLMKAVNKKWGFVADVSGISQGYALFELTERRVHVREVYVSPEFRRIGIGKRLMKSIGLNANYYPCDILLELPGRDIPEFEKARKFYESLGMTFISGNKERCDRMILKAENLHKLIH
ncbi:GNAT family N-acetyltransferase [Candidatus Pacearchaeota archaeon]|nr:GNAT family N-acetyltransferase [Candidatus Pacearchaeota archaeon]